MLEILARTPSSSNKTRPPPRAAVLYLLTEIELSQRGAILDISQKKVFYFCNNHDKVK